MPDGDGGVAKTHRPLGRALGACALIVWAAQGAGAMEQTGGGAKPGAYETATFAGGCFWCMQGPFDALPGVVSTRVGYTGGTTEHPTYEDVSSGATGHAEAVEVLYDPSKVGYGQLLEVFWRNIDPTDPQGQFADHGSQYRTAIFYHTPEQRRAAEASKAALAASGRFAKPIVTQIVPASPFYPAEDSHQAYYQKNAVRYNLYKEGSGRSAFLKSMWGSHTP